MASIDSVVSLLLLIGCCRVAVSTAAGCTAEAIEMCAGQLGTSDSPTFCTISLPTAKGCYVQLETCTMEGDMKKTYDEAMKKIKESEEGCDEKTSCSESLFQNCKARQNTPMAACIKSVSTIDCVKKLLVNCKDGDVKSKATEFLEELKKNETQLNCCNIMALAECGKDSPKMANATDLDDEKCQKLAMINKCMEPLVDCSDDDFSKSSIVGAFNGTVEGLKTCVAAGYKTHVGDAGINLQPTLLMLIPAVLVELLFILY